LAEAAYTPDTSNPNYIFFLSSIWAREMQCNQYRAHFIEVCRSLDDLQFEGGFAPRMRRDVPGFEQYTIERRYAFREYLRKLKRSALAFNTPAVLGCHGWKLGEFLALGKAIISTPLSRALPKSLIHGEHVHFVDGSPDSIKEAVCLIRRDNAYRQQLELGARTYYLEYLQPQRIIERILNIAR
jgi:glycosyltransferase involved in cell wall biosynthesis